MNKPIAPGSALAERLRRKADRIDPTRVCRPYRRPGRSPVCTENSIRVDHVSESPNVGDNDRAVLPLRGPVRLAVQVEEST